MHHCIGIWHIHRYIFELNYFGCYCVFVCACTHLRVLSSTLGSSTYFMRSYFVPKVGSWSITTLHVLDQLEDRCGL